MALITDWLTDTASVTSSVSIQHHTSTPLNGNRSVRFNITNGSAVGSKGAGAVFLVTPTYTRGHIMGRLRTLMRVDSNLNQSGIYFLASQDIGIAGLGSAYMFGPSGINNALVLRKTSGGLYNTSFTLLDSTNTSLGISPTTAFAVEVEWKASIDIFGGTHIICRYGTSFGSLVEILEYVDESSPLTVSSAEGLFAFVDGADIVGQAVFDDTSLYNITLT